MSLFKQHDMVIYINSDYMGHLLVIAPARITYVYKNVFQGQASVIREQEYIYECYPSHHEFQAELINLFHYSDELLSLISEIANQANNLILANRKPNIF